MTTRRWLPSEWMDEVIPEPRDSPSAWIFKSDDGSYSVADNETAYGSQDLAGAPLAEGDVVEFSWTEDHGQQTVSFNGAGGWTLAGAEPTATPGSTMLYIEIYNAENMTDSLDELCRSEMERDPSAHDIEVSFYAWSDASVRHVFHGGVFVPVTLAS